MRPLGETVELDRRGVAQLADALAPKVRQQKSLREAEVALGVGRNVLQRVLRRPFVLRLSRSTLTKLVAAVGAATVQSSG